MLLTIGDLTRFTAKTKDGSFPIKDIFFSLAEGKVDYLVIDTGTWFETDTVLVSAGCITEVSTDDRSVSLDVDEEQIRSAPVWREGQTSLIDAMPPILVGPFGNTISPAMMGAISSSINKERAEGDQLTRSLERFNAIKGSDVFGTDGQLGSVVDFLLLPETHKLSHLIIDDGKALPGRQLVVPIETLRYQAKQETHLVVDISSSQLADAPQMENADRIDRNWLDALRSYYQLPV